MVALIFLSAMAAAQSPATEQTSITGAARPSVEWAVVWFSHPTSVLDATLCGRYVIVHDRFWHREQRPCTSFYELEDGRARQRVVTFSCQLIQKPIVADQFRVWGAPA